MNNRDKVIQFIVENVTTSLGYTLMEIKNNYYGLVSPWVLLKEEEDGFKKAIIFCNEQYENNNDYHIKIDINNHIGSNNISLNKVIFIDDEEKEDELIRNINCFISENSSYTGECIILDKEISKIFYYSAGNENLVTIISYFINEIKNKEKRIRDKNTFSITYILIGINVLMYLITAILSGNIIDSNVNVLVFLGAKVNPLIERGEYYRLITCTFLHGGIIHLGLNMYALNALGPLIEKVYGKVKYIIIYFISGITSSLLSYLLSDSISIGASGAIFGLLGACLIIALKLKDQVGKGFVSNIISVIFVNLIIGFSIANVDNFGHLGGLIGGTVISLFLWKNV